MPENVNPSAHKAPPASVTPALKNGGRVVLVSREYKHTTEDGRVVCTVRQAVNPVRRNRTDLRKAGLSTKQIKKIERKARRLQRGGQRVVGEAMSALSLAALQKGAFSTVGIERPEPACPADTRGTGDCGRRFCEVCGPGRGAA